MSRALDRRQLSLEEFVEELKRLGFLPGACVYLHSSMDEISRRVPGMDPNQFVKLLKELVGRDGTLLVPTFPISSLQYHYVQSHRMFDVQRTPSMTGLFTEVFRKSDGVVRSFHPTHPVAAWGRHSQELVARHHWGTAFGETSPVYKMQQLDGVVAGIGITPKRCYTLYHIAEEIHPKSHALHYSNERYEMIIVNGRERIPYIVTPLRPDRVRRYDRAERILMREGILRCYTVKGLKFSSTRVREFLERSLELIGSEKFYRRNLGLSRITFRKSSHPKSCSFKKITSPVQQKISG